MNAIEKGENKEIAVILKQYKTPQGGVNYPAILSVPSSDRLPALYKQDFLKATALVVTALAMAFDRMNLKKKKDNNVGILINNIAEDVIDTAEEDNLSMEDLLLFLQNMVRGKYGVIEEISVGRFMALFDKYRDDRHDAYVEYKENQHLQYKSMGDADRSAPSNPLAEHFSRIGNSLHELRMNLAEQRKENATAKKAEQFYGKETTDK